VRGGPHSNLGGWWAAPLDSLAPGETQLARDLVQDGGHPGMPDFCVCKGVAVSQPSLPARPPGGEEGRTGREGVWGLPSRELYLSFT
jgi:hypothetical protein